MAPSIPIDFVGQKGSKSCSIAPVMGKARKISKGFVSGLGPEYRHSVDTMAESEGFGSSGRVEMETISDDSQPAKSKWDGFRLDRNDRYHVSVQVLPLSTYSRHEKRDLKMRLMRELEQVRNFERRLPLNADVVISPSSETRSCSDGKKRPPFNSHQGPSSVSNMQQGPKFVPPICKGPGFKNSHSGKLQPGRSAVSNNTSNDAMFKQCLTTLNKLLTHQYGWVFKSPVDAVKLNIPDYHTVIKNPMDLGTVKQRLTSGEYPNLLHFAADVRLTFSNAMVYNPPGTDVHIMADTLSKLFESRWKSISKKLSSSVDVQSIPSNVVRYFDAANNIPTHAVSKNEVSSTDSKKKLDPVKRIMSDDEKQSLTIELDALLVELPDKIVDFLKERSTPAGETCEDEIEIDLEVLDDDTLFELKKLLDEYKLEKQKKQSGAEPCEIELVHESGISNSSVLPGRGGGPADMDVDIGENDPPVANYPPIEIDKDDVHKESKQNSSSASSSDLGSSSHDSGSSSGNESDGAEVSANASIPKDSTVNPVEIAETDKSDMKDVNENIPHHEKNDLPNKEAHTYTNSQQEGENALPERPVSPDKLYRAALLRSRFADTILKAREKTMEQGENQDPEKLRIEREQLEKQQKAEKARLQAEAKAAEEARKRAEEEAAAEARRKRELEREAAREALLKMEKTVEINENSKFMEDLEMLRVAAAEEVIPSTSAEEKIPDHSLERLSSFNFQVDSNPLEQLGLYIKADDEEDDDDEEEEEYPNEEHAD